MGFIPFDDDDDHDKDKEGQPPWTVTPGQVLPGKPPPGSGKQWQTSRYRGVELSRISLPPLVHYCYCYCDLISIEIRDVSSGVRGSWGSQRS